MKELKCSSFSCFSGGHDKKTKEMFYSRLCILVFRRDPYSARYRNIV